jgi:carotenoid 1,2-hydratase
LKWRPAAKDWSGHGYMDSNWGTEPLEDGFKLWDWARGLLPDGDAVILYDAIRKDGGHGQIALRIGRDGDVQPFEMPEKKTLAKGFWGVPRSGHHDHGPGAGSQSQDRANA